MKKVIEYIVVGANGYDFLIKKVNRLIKEGLQPYGELVICTRSDTNTFNQVMVKYED